MLNRLWPWALLAVAAIIFVDRFIPGFFLATMDTETIVLPVFYQDVAVAHHASGNWAWGGFSALFPDVLLFFGLNSLFPDGGVALQLLQMCFFAGWLCATVALVIELERPHKLGLLSILLLLWVGLAFNFGFPDNWGITIERSLFQPIYHSGTGIMTSICLVLLLHQIRHGWGIGFWWLFVLTFLGGVSDVLFTVVFAGSALISVALLTLAFRKNWKWYLALVGNLTAASAAAYLIGPHLFPPSLATNYYLQFSWDRVQSALDSITTEVFRPEHHLFALIMVLDIFTIVGGIFGLLFFCFSARRKYISPVVFSLMVFCSCSVFANWAAVITTGDYVDMNANRYTTVALLIPLFILAFGLHAIILWRSWLEKLFAVAVSAFTLTVAFIPQQHSFGYDGVNRDLPFLKKLMDEQHTQSCLGCYWCANIVTFLSHGEVPVRSLTNGATIYHWFNSLEWFGKGHPEKDWPRFRLIYGPDHGYSQVFGNPDQVLFAPSGAEVWLYSEAHCIRYNEYFDVLSNSFLDDGRTVRFNPATQPGGPRNDGNARIAIDHDGGGWLEYGPYIVLEPGHYRATFRYSFSVLPKAGQEPTYDVLMHTGDKETSFDEKPLPCPDTKPQVFSDDFTVTEPNHQYEMRIFYHSSGSIRIDALELTLLGK